MIYDINYFIQKFPSIPEELWTTGSEGVASWSIKKCVYGHCGIRDELSVFQNEEAKALSDLITGKKTPTLLRGYLNWGWACINDGGDPYYQQATPKQRVLAKLYDLQKPKLKPFKYETRKENRNTRRYNNVYH